MDSRFVLFILIDYETRSADHRIVINENPTFNKAPKKFQQIVQTKVNPDLSK